ncbi:hypothetical protein [Nitrososphaera viennensis]|uniref:Uncharacterized protein n=1 Tax=Nitrososphaera viennensis TaxID=1034015 RepID=A0A977IBX3_9ARCH|nr:hypothetical protein [Nitrososphaera viennensis]UVS68113.1 hypothetical protein NWT39_09395 [Nitrososphaera viennensis]
MSESALEGAIFFMMRTYLDSGLVTPEQANHVLQRLQERTKEYCSSRYHSGGAKFRAE